MQQPSLVQTVLGALAAVFGAVVGAVRAAAGAVFNLLGPRGMLIAAAAIVALLVIVFVAVPGVQGCSSASAAQETATEQGSESGQSTDEASIDQAALSAIVGDDIATQLVQTAETDADVAWIAAHPDAYAVDGESVQYKLLKLAADEPAARSFVRSFPDVYPAEAGQPYEDGTGGGVPRLYQWDERWGSTVYCSTTFALTGCCPTSLSMVYMALTGDTSLTPYEMGVRAEQGGYMDTYNGTDATFLENEASKLGLRCNRVSASAERLRSALSAGSVVICKMEPGDFTTTGHFIVATGLADDGTLLLNDPYSEVRSNASWAVETVVNQASALYVYSA